MARNAGLSEDSNEKLATDVSAVRIGQPDHQTVFDHHLVLGPGVRTFKTEGFQISDEVIPADGAQPRH